MNTAFGFLSERCGQLGSWAFKQWTLWNVVTGILFLIFVSAVGDWEDIEPLLFFSESVYGNLLPIVSHPDTVSVCLFIAILHRLDPRPFNAAIRGIRAGWQSLVDTMHDFHSLEDGEHVEKNNFVMQKQAKPKGRRFGIPKHLLPAFQKRPVATQPAEVEESKVEEPKPRFSSDSMGKSKKSNGKGKGKKK